MRKKSVSEIMLALLSIGILGVVFNVRLAAAQGPVIRNLIVQISPWPPTTCGEVYVTVGFYILEAYHFVDFGPLKRVGNMFSVDINVSAVGLDIYGPFHYKQTYALANCHKVRIGLMLLFMFTCLEH